MRGRRKRAGYILFVHAPSFLSNLHTTLLHKIQFCLPPERPHCKVILPFETHMGGFEVRNVAALTVATCIALF